MNRKFLSVIFSLIVFVFGFTSCITTTTAAGAVGANRGQLMLVSAAAIDQSSKQSYEEVIAQAKAKNILNTNKTTTARVQKISQNLIKQAAVFRPDTANWDWQVNVITDKTINAWCLPGGRIVVYTGIIDTLSLNDAQLAAVIGHEISHALREHSREQISRQFATELGAAAFSRMLRLNDAGKELVSLASDLVLTLPFSRSQETEADNMGTELMARAGYNPYEAAAVWEKMNKLTTSSTPELLSTHPSNTTRIQNINQIAAKVYPLYKK